MANQILLGVVLGFAGAAPFVIVLDRLSRHNLADSGVRNGLVCVVASALIVLVGMVLIRRLWAEAFAAASVSAVLTMLVVVTSLVLTMWHRLS